MSVRRTLVTGMLVLTALGLNIVGISAASAASGPKIGPNQEFVGLVNGSTGLNQHAVIKVACPGPAQGQTTHPLEGQTLSVSLPASTGGTVGDTGPRGRHITVFQGIPPESATTASAAAKGLPTFTHYGTKKLPTSITVPCSGTGYFTFMPFPRDPGASRAFVVAVDFANIAA